MMGGCCACATEDIRTMVAAVAKKSFTDSSRCRRIRGGNKIRRGTPAGLKNRSTDTLKAVMLILASSSPRRRELLKLAGLDFTVEAADIDERIQPDETPAKYVQRLAVEK